MVRPRTTILFAAAGLGALFLALSRRKPETRRTREASHLGRSESPAPLRMRPGPVPIPVDPGQEELRLLAAARGTTEIPCIVQLHDLGGEREFPCIAIVEAGKEILFRFAKDPGKALSAWHKRRVKAAKHPEFQAAAEAIA